MMKIIVAVWEITVDAVIELLGLAFSAIPAVLMIAWVYCVIVVLS